MGMGLRKKGVNADLNVTPMIDILLVLLIIFMVITPMMMMQHRVEVPQRSEVDLPPELTSDQTVLTFTRDGNLFLNQTPVERELLRSKLAERFENRRDKMIFVNIDPEANYGESVRVIDAVKNSGLDKIAVVKLKDGEKFQVPGEAVQ